MTDVATLLSISNTMSAAETRLPQAGGEARSSPQLHDASASPAAAQDAPDGDSIMLLEPRPFRPFKTSEEYLYAMREDLAEWLKNLYQLDINVDNFFEILETGEVLCGHANNVRRLAEEQRQQGLHPEGPSAGGGRRFSSKWEIPQYDVVYRTDVAPGSFFARDNVHNFIAWCRDLGIYEVLLFETDDLVMRKNEKHVILSLLEVARRGARYGMAAPLLVQMEHDIDREMEKDRLAEERRENGGLCGGEFDHENGDWNDDGGDLEDETPQMFYGPQAQIITNDLKSLDEMVRDLVERCSCPSQFPMVKVSEGKYRIGDTRVLIFVRILRNHVMVRVGGGWDTLEHYLDKHDPCRCRQGHRTALSSRVGFKTSSSGQERQLMNVTYERSGGHEQGQTPSPRTQTQSRDFANDKSPSRKADSPSLSNHSLRGRNPQRKLSPGPAALSATFNPLNKYHASTPHKVSKPVKNRLFRSQESLHDSTPKITPQRKRSVNIPLKLGKTSPQNTSQKTNQQCHKVVRKTKSASPGNSALPAPQQQETKGDDGRTNKTLPSPTSRIPQRKLGCGRLPRPGENRVVPQHKSDCADTSIEELKINPIPRKILPVTSTPKPYKSLGIPNVIFEVKEDKPALAFKNNKPSVTKIPTFAHNKPSVTTRDPSSTNDANKMSKIPSKTPSTYSIPSKEKHGVPLKTGGNRNTESMQSTPRRSPKMSGVQRPLEQKAKQSLVKASLIPTKSPAPINASVSARTNT